MKINNLKLSNEGLNHLIQWEGQELRPYKDVAGYKTIGSGHLLTKDEIESGVIVVGGRKIRWADGISDRDSRRLLKQDAAIAQKAVNMYVTVPLSQHQFDALVSFVFNVGQGNFRKSTLLKLLNQGRYEEVPAQLKKWRKAGGRVVQGLINRRKSTIALWRKEKLKSPIASRTNQGSVIAGAGMVINSLSEAQAISESANSFAQGFGEHAQTIGIVIALAGLAYVMYARYDDRRHGVK